MVQAAIIMIGMISPQSKKFATKMKTVPYMTGAVLIGSIPPTELCAPRDLAAIIINGASGVQCVSNPPNPVHPESNVHTK